MLHTKPNASEVIISENENQSHSYEDVLRRIGFGKVQIIVLLTSGLFCMLATNEVFGMGIVAIVSKCDFDLSAADKGILTGVTYIGNVCATYMWGYLSDTKGRRPVIIYSGMLSSLLTIFSVLISNFWAYVFMKFLVGFCICGSTSVAYAYLGEFISDKHRAIVINYASIFNALTLFYVPWISWAVLSMDWSLQITENFILNPWRLLVVFYFLPAIIGAFVMYFLPESPKILLSLGDSKGAYEALDWICRHNLKGQSLKSLDITNILSLAEDELNRSSANGGDKNSKCLTVLKKMWNDTKPLFERPHVYNFLICCITMSSVFMSSIGMGMWFPDIQNRFRFDENASEEAVCEIIKASYLAEANALNTTCTTTISRQMYIDYSIFGTICLSGYIILGAIINRFKRKNILTVFLIICGICGICALLFLDAVGILLSFSLFLVLPELGASLLNGIVVDLVPTYLRGQAVCFCIMTGRLSAVIATNLVGLIIEKECSTTFIFFSVFSLVCAVLTFFLPSNHKQSKEIK